MKKSLATDQKDKQIRRTNKRSQRAEVAELLKTLLGSSRMLTQVLLSRGSVDQQTRTWVREMIIL